MTIRSLRRACRTASEQPFLLLGAGHAHQRLDPSDGASCPMPDARAACKVARSGTEQGGHGGPIMPRRVTGALVHGLFMAAALGASLPAWSQGMTERMSVGPNGVEGNAWSGYPVLSANGQSVAFRSDASNLVPGDTNGRQDVFVRDRRTGTTERVSLGPNGRQGNADSLRAALSANGRFVAFVSYASNLVPGDTNGTYDVFVHDRRTGTTERVSLGPNGRQGNGNSDNPSLSSDGQFVAFYSYASNLVPGDTNGERDVFVRDRQTGTTERVNLGPNGVQGNDFSGSYGAIPALSANGRFVAFDSSANNLVQDDTNGQADVFVHTR
jgi:Tol biopolymer transport system component